MNTLEKYGWNRQFRKAFEVWKDQNLVPGRVIRGSSGIYTVMTEQGEREARIAGRFHYTAVAKVDYPVAGDWVAFQDSQGDGSGIIHAVLPRKNLFSRKSAGERTEEQGLAANVDRIFVVSALDQDFSIRRLERYLALVHECGAEAVIILSKSDLCSDVEAQLAAVRSAAQGVPAFPLSVLNGSGMDVLESFLEEGRTAALIGSSGVGKTSLINAILGIEAGRIGDVRENDHRGRHTTTNRELVLLPAGGMLIDNPGLREVQLWSSEDSLNDVFTEIEALAASCRFRDCSHETEPGCAVQAALENGTLSGDRFASYLKLKKEIAFLQRRQDDYARQQEKEKWKKISKWQKHHARKGQ